MSEKIIQAKINDIRIDNCFRKDIGSLAELASSIEENDLLQPIGITSEYELMFGRRRLLACRDVLERKRIPARIVNVKSILHGQIAENLMRKEYTVSERVAIVDALRSFRHGGDRRSDQARNGDDENLTVDRAAKLAGPGGKDTYSRAKNVEENGVPELRQSMNSGQLSMHAAHELSKAAPDEQQECLAKRHDEGKATARAIQKDLRRIRLQKEREETMARAVESPEREGDIQLHHCRFQELEKHAGLQPESVACVCTDIPYGSHFVEQIAELAAFAERVLMPGGTFVAHLGQHRLDEKLHTLGKYLTYQWMMTTAWEGLGNDVASLKLISKSIPIAVYSKGQWQPLGSWLDTCITQVQEKDWHPWQRPLEEVEQLVRYFSKPGDLVVDPCGRGFTTAIACLRNHRRFVGCDNDKAAVVKEQDRLKKERTEPADLLTKTIPLSSGTEDEAHKRLDASDPGSKSA